MTSRVCKPGRVQFSVLVEVRHRPGIADPQGATIERALPTLGYANVRDVKVGKALRFVIEANDEQAARRQIDEMCAQFLTNPVLEDAEVSLEVLAESKR